MRASVLLLPSWYSTCLFYLMGLFCSRSIKSILIFYWNYFITWTLILIFSYLSIICLVFTWFANIFLCHICSFKTLILFEWHHFISLSSSPIAPFSTFSSIGETFSEFLFDLFESFISTIISF